MLKSLKTQISLFDAVLFMSSQLTLFHTVQINLIGAQVGRGRSWTTADPGLIF